VQVRIDSDDASAVATAGPTGREPQS
jgi:hypothetical protein